MDQALVLDSLVLRTLSQQEHATPAQGRVRRAT